jgi:hypothetical protein
MSQLITLRSGQRIKISTATDLSWLTDLSHINTVEALVNAILTSKQITVTENGLFIRGLGDSNGWFWIKGKRLYKPTEYGSAVDQIQKVLEDQAEVETGIVCAGSDTPVKATPGKFVALKTVPKLKNDGTDNPNWIPQLPMPGGTDPDNVLNFWEWIGPSSVCVDEVLTEV